MNPRGSATLAAAFYPAVVIAGWAVVSLAGIGSPRIETSAAAHVVDRLAPSLTASIDWRPGRKPMRRKHWQMRRKPMRRKAIATSYVAPDTPEVAAAAELVAKPAPIRSLADMKPVTDATAAEAGAEHPSSWPR